MQCPKQEKQAQTSQEPSGPGHNILDLHSRPSIPPGQRIYYEGFLNRRIQSLTRHVPARQRLVSVIATELKHAPLVTGTTSLRTRCALTAIECKKCLQSRLVSDILLVKTS
mmetsp:Transcript_44153/g.70613  ORF Transcript_44153/g.70613 Transcript_44153/m.70613 type:complete len:111 (+) Transcript_44153:826-1158(+)